MMRLLPVSVMILIFSTMSFAADFAPVPMVLTAPGEIEYQFNGTELNIPLEITGKPAAVWLVINTDGQAENIVDIRNGYLGWHYVNKIDTTVYVSSRYQRDIGLTSIMWDGKDQDGNNVAAGTYKYHFWAYDDQTAREPVCDFVMLGYDWDSPHTYVFEVGEDGLPLAQPMIMGAVIVWLDRSNPDDILYRRHGIHMKWLIGSDPHDLTLLQTTRCKEYLSAAEIGGDPQNGEFGYGGPAFDPNDYNTFYHTQIRMSDHMDTMRKWTWVTDGEAIVDEDWGGFDEISLESSIFLNYRGRKPTCFTDRNYMYIPAPGLHDHEIQWSKLRCVSFDGEVLFEKKLNEWYLPDDGNPHGYVNGAFHHLASRGNNNWLLVAHTSCLNEMIDTGRLLDDPDADEEDYIVWQNANGDYWMDSAYEPTVEPAWYCLADDKTTSMRRESACIDAQGFNVIYTGYLGITSFGVSTQDGTAVDYMAFSDDTIGDDTFQKGGGQLCDYGSNYDGLYMAGAITAETTGAYSDKGTGTSNYVAFDSVGGIITNQPTAVEEEGQNAFSVEQNAPNPFNPTTSISFTIPDADQVTVEIYNVAGQKIDTLANNFMDAGTHSVVWDASGFSNGVYFYTVKSGDFSKTMKMTLLK